MAGNEMSWPIACREVVEAAYDEAATTEAWLTRVVEALAPLVDDGRGIAGTVVAKDSARFTVDARVVRQGPVASCGPRSDRVSELDAVLPRCVDAMAAFCLSGRPLTSLAELRSLVDPETPDFLHYGSLPDARVFVGHAALQASVVIVAPTTGFERSPHQLRDLTRLALHVETGLRLHLRRVHPARVAGLEERVVGMRPGDDAWAIDDAWGPWEAVTAGTHSVIETRDPSGSTSFRVLANPAPTRVYRALSMRETAVARLVGRGHSGKATAYALQTSEAVVSSTLGDVAAKIGLRSRTSVASFVGAVLAAESARPHHRFTEAERTVLELVRAGCSNSEIALQRGTSARTIANQVASLLRKTKTPSRRALAAVAARAPHGAAARPGRNDSGP